jgi:hypothetical protein
MAAALTERDQRQVPLFAEATAGDDMEAVKTRTLVRNTWKPKARQ